MKRSLLVPLSVLAALTIPGAVYADSIAWTALGNNGSVCAIALCYTQSNAGSYEVSGYNERVIIENCGGGLFYGQTTCTDLLGRSFPCTSSDTHAPTGIAYTNLNTSVSYDDLECSGYHAIYGRTNSNGHLEHFADINSSDGVTVLGSAFLADTDTCSLGVMGWFDSGNSLGGHVGFLTANNGGGCGTQTWLASMSGYAVSSWGHNEDGPSSTQLFVTGAAENRYWAIVTSGSDNGFRSVSTTHTPPDSAWVATSLTQSGAPTTFLDIGANGETVVWAYGEDSGGTKKMYRGVVTPG